MRKSHAVTLCDDGAFLSVLEKAQNPAVGCPHAFDVWLRSCPVEQLASALRQILCDNDLASFEPSLG